MDNQTDHNPFENFIFPGENHPSINDAADVPNHGTNVVDRTHQLDSSIIDTSLPPGSYHPAGPYVFPPEACGRAFLAAGIGESPSSLTATGLQTDMALSNSMTGADEYDASYRMSLGGDVNGGISALWPPPVCSTQLIHGFQEQGLDTPAAVDAMERQTFQADWTTASGLPVTSSQVMNYGNSEIAYDCSASYGNSSSVDFLVTGTAKFMRDSVMPCPPTSTSRVFHQQSQASDISFSPVHVQTERMSTVPNYWAVPLADKCQDREPIDPNVDTVLHPEGAGPLPLINQSLIPQLLPESIPHDGTSSEGGKVPTAEAVGSPIVPDSGAVVLGCETKLEQQLNRRRKREEWKLQQIAKRSQAPAGHFVFWEPLGSTLVPRRSPEAQRNRNEVTKSGGPCLLCWWRRKRVSEMSFQRTVWPFLLIRESDAVLRLKALREVQTHPLAVDMQPGG